MTAHWGMADPARATGTDTEKALAYAELHRRIVAFSALPLGTLQKVALQNHLDRLGRS